MCMLKFESPLEAFDDWYREAEASEEALPDAISLATSDRAGQANVRTMLFKGRIDENFKFFTNYQSKKGQQLIENPKASILFFWKKLYRQIRIEGEVSKLSAKESDEYWQSRPRESQIGAWASAQSSPVESLEKLEAIYQKYFEDFKNEKIIPRPPHWGGFQLKAHRIEFWQGREFRLHHRVQFVFDGAHWKKTFLFP